VRVAGTHAPLFFIITKRLTFQNMGYYDRSIALIHSVLRVTNDTHWYENYKRFMY